MSEAGVVDPLPSTEIEDDAWDKITSLCSRSLSLSTHSEHIGAARASPLSGDERAFNRSAARPALDGLSLDRDHTPLVPVRQRTGSSILSFTDAELITYIKRSIARACSPGLEPTQQLQVAPIVFGRQP
jgi:hypothetical protein